MVDLLLPLHNIIGTRDTIPHPITMAFQSPIATTDRCILPLLALRRHPGLAMEHTYLRHGHHIHLLLCLTTLFPHQGSFTARLAMATFEEISMYLLHGNGN